jgi:hypothetical protein
MGDPAGHPYGATRRVAPTACVIIYVCRGDATRRPDGVRYHICLQGRCAASPRRRALSYMSAGAMRRIAPTKIFNILQIIHNKNIAFALSLNL